MVEPRRLNKLQESVDCADDETFTNSEHIGENHKGKKACESNRTALGQAEKFYVAQSETHRHENACVNDSFGAVVFGVLFAEDESQNHVYRNENGGKNVKNNFF